MAFRKKNLLTELMGLNAREELVGLSDEDFDTRSYYHEIRGALNSLFPWKGVWKPKIPKRVAFFLWIAAHS